MILYSFLITNLPRLTVSFVLISLQFIAAGQTLPETKRVIFSKETPILFDLYKDTSINRFTPTPNDIDKSDTLLHQYFSDTNAKTGGHISVTAYYRQYAGLLLNGKKIIFINAFCRQPDYFLKNTYYPKGGGQCYFRTLVDLDSLQVTEFHFNAAK